MSAKAVDIAGQQSVEPAWLWCVHLGNGPTLGLAVHAGHDIRPDLLNYVAIGEDVRLREEDPYTDYFAGACDSQIITKRSRFEVDLNRPVDEAICGVPDDCWGLTVWRDALPDSVRRRSMTEHAAFYRMFRKQLAGLAERYGRVVVFDVHSYNHRRGGPDAVPAPQASNPDINVGTGSMDRSRWGPLVDNVIESFRSCNVGGKALDTRENVKFRGRQIAAFVHETLPMTGCAIAIEVKKTFIDEWTGAIDDGQVRDLHRAFASAAQVASATALHCG